MLGFLACSFLMLLWRHALTSSSGSVPCCAWLWGETHTVPFADCGHRGNVLKISFPSMKYYHSCGCYERNTSTKEGFSKNSWHTVNDHVGSVQVVKYGCIQAFVEKANIAHWKQILSITTIAIIGMKQRTKEFLQKYYRLDHRHRHNINNFLWRI